MKRNWVKRRERDNSQAIRHTIQGLFLLLNAWIGFEFYQFVRHFETGGSGAGISRPAGVEGWLPIAGLMNTKYFLLTGTIPSIHPAAMFLFLTFLLISIVIRKGFCGWLCPIGSISEAAWMFGRKTFGRNFQLPSWLDIGVRSLKYILFGLFAYAVASMAPDDLDAFLSSPYGLIADVRMLDFFRYLSATSALVLAVLIISSFFVRNFWCRYLCPYGALMGIAGLLSPTRIRRTASSCIDCGKCSAVCPAHLPVDKLVQIRSAECTSCMSCVAACPAEGALSMALTARGPRISPWVTVALTAVLCIAIIGFAKVSGHWDSPIPAGMYQTLIPHAAQYGHP